MSPTLNPKQEQFCQEYLIDLNGSAAYRRAYPKVKSEATARANAARLLATANVAARVAELQKARSGRTEITQDRVLVELARLAFSDPRRLYRPDGTLKSPHEWDDGTAAAVASVETEEEITPSDQFGAVIVRTHKVKRWDKNTAITQAMRHLGMLNDKLHVEGTLPLVKVVDLSDAGTPEPAPPVVVLPPAGGGPPVVG